MTGNIQNAVQLYHDVRKASGKEVPAYPDFYDFALNKLKNENLVQIISQIGEANYKQPEKMVDYLNQNHFQVKKTTGKWVDLVESRKAGKAKVKPHVKFTKTHARADSSKRAESKEKAPQL